MKKFYFLISLCLFSFSLTAQTGLWTWVSGDNVPNKQGIYRTPGQPHPLNKPGARSGSVSWKDAKDNLWLYGGKTTMSTREGAYELYLSDLWKYDPFKNNWTWESGDTTFNEPGIYKSATMAPKPGARSGSVSWIDKNGILWLFGGFGNWNGKTAYFNDLWQYKDHNWTWVSGDNSPNQRSIYGTLYTPANGNKPGARSEAVSWIDADGALWLFGGDGYDSETKGTLNDLWKYDPSSNQWAWMGGDKVANQLGKYGVKGKAAEGNKPGARQGSVSWIDAKGIFWLFGGIGSSLEKFGYLNDLWRYNPRDKQWAWIQGDNHANMPGSYGTKNQPLPANKPGGREQAVGWIDAANNLWLCGGLGYDSRSVGSLNDLWKFDPSSDVWTWISGDNLINQQSSYGINGIAANGNKPGARQGSVSWIDNFGALWLFGGENGETGFGYIPGGFVSNGTNENPRPRNNDLWKYQELRLLCPSSVTKKADVTGCSSIVKNIDPVITPEVKYDPVFTLSGATTKSGEGTASGIQFLKGATTVKYSLPNYPSVTCTFLITVVDSTAPVPIITNLPDTTGECSVTVVTKPKATDNCAGSITGSTNDSLTYKTPGTYTITWTYNDGNGNSSKQTQRVIVKAGSGLPIPVTANLPEITGECSVNVTTRPTATQNCAGSFTATTNDPLFYTKPGTYTITWTYTNANGSVSQVQKVVVKDVSAPVPTLPTLPDLTAECTVTVQTKPTAKDSCAGIITGSTNDSLSYNTIGTRTITWTYNDGNGNSSKQTQRVIVKPSSGLPSPTNSNLPDITGECSVTITTKPTATQNCAGSLTATTNDPLSYTKQGIYSITWTYTNANGSVSQVQKVIIKDGSAPVPNMGTLPDLTGECQVTVQTKPTAKDSCAGVITGSTNDSLSYNTAGIRIITWTYNDGNGNSSSQTQRVIVKASSGLPMPTNSNLPDITGECSVTVSSIPTATQNCAGSLTATTNDPLSYTKPGTYTITWTYTNANGSVSQVQKVVVKDVSAPVPTLPTLPDLTAECTITVQTKPTAKDSCAGIITGSTTDSLSYNTIGTRTITWTYNDGNGNSSKQTQRVIVKASSGLPSPTNSNLPDITGECSVTITTKPTATQNCAGSLTATTNDPLSYTKQGTYSITWTYTNANGSVSQVQKVVVKDVSAPVPKAVNLPDITGECEVTVSNMPTATDNCGGTIAAVTTEPLSYKSLGTYNIIWTYTDANGNISRQSQRVIVKPSSGLPSPVISNLPDVTGECSATVVAKPSATQNCAGNIVATTSDPLTYTRQGTYTITWTYSSPGGTVSQEQKVIVRDVTAPVPNMATLPDITGECSARVVTRPTASDNCSGTVTATTSDLLVYNSQGTHHITWQFADANGNVSTQIQRIIVKDQTPPVPNVITLPDLVGECSVQVSQKPTANDNCIGTIAATTSDPLFYDVQGNYTINWKYTDAAGNTVLQKQQVIVKTLALKISAFPNPANNQFNIVVKSCSNEKITLRIFDALGRLMDLRSVTAGDVVTVGFNYPSNVYFAQLAQGKEQVVLKLSKIR